jgi:hypothetical protein
MENRKYDRAYLNGSRQPIDASFDVEGRVVYQQHSHGNDIGANRPAANTQYHPGQHAMLVEQLMEKNILETVHHCSKNHVSDHEPLGKTLDISMAVAEFNRASGKSYKTACVDAAKLVDVIKKTMKGNRSKLAFVFKNDVDVSRTVAHSGSFAKEAKVLVDQAIIDRIERIRVDINRLDADVNSLYLDLKARIEANGGLAFTVLGSNISAFRGSIVSKSIVARLSSVSAKPKQRNVAAAHVKPKQQEIAISVHVGVKA